MIPGGLGLIRSLVRRCIYRWFCFLKSTCSIFASGPKHVKLQLLRLHWVTLTSDKAWRYATFPLFISLSIALMLWRIVKQNRRDQPAVFDVYEWASTIFKNVSFWVSFLQHLLVLGTILVSQLRVTVPTSRTSITRGSLPAKDKLIKIIASAEMCKDRTGKLMKIKNWTGF